MRAFVIIASVVALVRGRPEAGYSYPSPGGGALGGSLVQATSVGGGHGGGHSGGFSHGGGSFGGGGLSFGGAGGGGSLALSGGGGFTGLGGGFGGTGGGFDGAGFGGAIGGGGFSGDFGGFVGGGGGSLVQKHIYVHVPPPEPQEFHAPRVIPVAPAQKHYKIIFIKAPTAPTPTVPIIPAQPQNEEKTLVYVLVKKPEEAPEIRIPQPIPTQPSKPEVYFIRYKTQKGAGGIGGEFGGSGVQINLGGGGLGGGSIGGGGLGGGSFGGSFGHSGGSLNQAAGLSATYGPPGHKSGGPH